MVNVTEQAETVNGLSQRSGDISNSTLHNEKVKTFEDNFAIIIYYGTDINVIVL